MSQVFLKCSVFAERYTEWSFSGNKRLLHAGTTRGYFARNRYVAISFPHGQCYPFLGGAISVLYIVIFIVWIPHLSLVSSLLSLLLAIVSYTSGSYVVVVELSRFFSVLSHLRGTDFISSSERLSCEIPECWRTLRFKHLEVGTESRDRIFSFLV